jgi:hypothetical protein
MHRNPHNASVAGVLVLILLILAGCGTQSITPVTSQMLLATPAQTDVPCLSCAQATLAALQTQEKIGADAQAAATAEIMRANAQATLNSASSTLSSAQTQEQNNANIIAAQIAATAAIVRANAQATLDSAGATQNAALTQDAIRQTQMADLSTSNAQALMNQQYQANLAAGTQTAIANNIATQTQSAAATSQWYTDQERQRDEQQRGPIAFLWTWCLPVFLIVLAGLIIWGTWRWLKIKQANQRILEIPVEKLQASEVLPHHHHAPPYLESEFIDDGYQVTKPNDQVRQWLDEVKDQLQSSDEKDKEDDDTNT